MNMQTIALIPTCVVLAIATLTDLRSRRIPNWLVVPFFLVGIAASCALNGLDGLGASLLGALLALAVVGPFCYLGGMGMGDLKLLISIGVWLGPSQLFLALVMTGLAGGIIAIAAALYRGYLREALGNLAGLLTGFGKEGIRPHERLVLSNPLARKVPYAPAIALGTVFSFLGQGV